MKKLLSVAAIIIAALLILASCSVSDSTNSPSASSANSANSRTAEGSETVLDDPTDEKREANGDFSIKPLDGAAEPEVSGSVYTVKSGGEYEVLGKLDEGCIVVDAGDDAEVKLTLNGTSIECSSQAPISAVGAAELTVKAEEGSYNVITDSRTAPDGTGSEDAPDGAIYAECDLKLSGKGTLIVNSSYDNGVKSKDDIKIKNLTLKVTSPGNALKGNDSVTVESGDLILVSTSSDGVKTKNSDVSSKGNQRGSVVFEGGHTDIYAACDGISAAYNVEISGEDCVVNIYTASYASSSGEHADSDYYLLIPSSAYSKDVGYYAGFYNDGEDIKWVLCEYETMVRGGRNSYYGLSFKVPSGYSNVIFNTVPSGTVPDGDNYTASSGGETVNGSMNGYLVDSVGSGKISGDWVQISSGNGSNSNKTTYSSKGIKAENSVEISSGSVTIYSMDDGIHANSDSELENGAAAAGTVNVSGGNITVTAADDGIHADAALTISGGNVNVVESHEGLEANVITIAGGNTKVYGGDDGLNACKGSKTPLVNITGGSLEVTTPSGDTDAIDSNGNFTMSGGSVLVKGGAASGGMAGSVDVDGSVKVTGGTIVAFGGISETPSSGSVNTYISNGTSFPAGDYVLADKNGGVIKEFSLESSYNSVWIASDAFALNGDYVLTKGGSELLSWNQSSSTVGSAGNSGFGGGGFGGGGFGPGGRR